MDDPHCTTHHDACPRREDRHREEIARLTRERDAARAECRAWKILAESVSAHRLECTE